MSKEKHIKFESPVGWLKVTEKDGAITAVNFVDGEDKGLTSTDSAVLEKAVHQLKEYFSAQRKNFDLTLNFSGTDFQKRVWTEIENIPYGKTISYMDIAKRLGDPKAVRAVGMACNKNPIAIICPCHRVIGSDGDLTGYYSGIDRKRDLLSIENPMVFGKQTSLF